MSARRLRHAEGDVGGAAGGVDLELLAQAPHQPEHLLAGGAHGADRHDQRIDDDVLRLDAVIGRALDDLLCHLEADVGVFQMPVSSLEMATTGTLYLATSGRMASSRSSSPVTELTSGRPLTVSSPTFSAAGTEESMQSGNVDRRLHDLQRLAAAAAARSRSD